MQVLPLQLFAFMCMRALLLARVRVKCGSKIAFAFIRRHFTYFNHRSLSPLFGTISEGLFERYDSLFK